MGAVKAVVYALLMFALSAAHDGLSQAALRDFPLPWIVATLHFGVGVLWIFPSWAFGLRQTPSLNDLQKKRVAPLAFLHAAGYVCSLGIFEAGSVSVSYAFQGLEPAAVSVMLWMAAENSKHFVNKLALLPLVVGVAVTFREGLWRSWPVSLSGVCMALFCGARTAFSHKIMQDEAVALKGQMCSVIFVSGCLVLIPFAIVMEGAQVVVFWERAAAAVGSGGLVVRLAMGGTIFYMWSECLFGLLEDSGPAKTAVAVAIGPVVVNAFRSAFSNAGWTMGGWVGTGLVAVGTTVVLTSAQKYTVKARIVKQ